MYNSLISLCFTIYFILVISGGFTDASEKVKKFIDENDEANDDTKDETMEIPSEMDKNTSACSRRSGGLVHEIRKASQNQFPFVVALMSSRNEYVCAGAMVSNGLIVTSADCATLANDALFNTTVAKKDSTVVTLPILKNENFPTNTRNVAVLYTRKLNTTNIFEINISNITKAEDLGDVEAIGFGLNAEPSQQKEMQYVGLMVDHMEKCSGYLNCIETKVPSCFRDKGGPVIFNNELVGIVTQGSETCIPELTSKYALNKHMIDFIESFVFKTWLKEKITKNNENSELAHDIVAQKTRIAESVHVLTADSSSGQPEAIIPSLFFLLHIIVNVL